MDFHFTQTCQTCGGFEPSQGKRGWSSRNELSLRCGLRSRRLLEACALLRAASAETAARGAMGPLQAGRGANELIDGGLSTVIGDISPSQRAIWQGEHSAYN